jgi:hypothetical protein
LASLLYCLAVVPATIPDIPPTINISDFFMSISPSRG